MKAHHLKHTTLVFLGIFALILSSLGYWYVRYAVISQAENYSLAIKEEETYNENKKNEQNYRRMFNQTIDDRAKLNTYIISEDKIINFIESIEQIGQLTGTEVVLSSIDSDAMKDVVKGDVGHIKAHVDIRGNWSGVMSALTMLENLPFSISIGKSRLFYSKDVDTTTASTATINKKITNRAGFWNLAANISVLSLK